MGYRIDQVDGGFGRQGDTYRLRLTNGFDSGPQRLRSGFIDVER